MSLEQRLLALIDLYMEGDMPEEQAAELVGLLRRSPKSVGIFRDLLATDYHLREAYHDEVYRKSLQDGVTEKLRRVATADDFLTGTLNRIQALGERWGQEERARSRSVGLFTRLFLGPFVAVGTRLREFLPASE